MKYFRLALIAALILLPVTAVFAAEGAGAPAKAETAEKKAPKDAAEKEKADAPTPPAKTDADEKKAPEKEELKAPAAEAKADEKKTAPSPAGPADVVKAFAEAFNKCDGKGLVKLLSAECVKQTAKKVRENVGAAGDVDMTEDDFKDDAKVAARALDMAIKEIKACMDSEKKKFEFSLEILEEKINGDKATVTAGNTSGTKLEIPLVKENGAWKIDKLN